MANRPSALCGCYYTISNNPNTDSVFGNYGVEKRYLPLVKSDVHASIYAWSSRSTLKQTFINSSNNNIEKCIYMFPLYEGVSVVSFTCCIGNRVLHGVVNEKAKAKATFDQAVSKGEMAGLLEQSEQASDVFSTSLGNLAPQEKVHVEITYIGELKNDVDVDGIRYTVPTIIAPRYGAGPTGDALAGSVPSGDAGGISLSIDVQMPQSSPLQSIQSPSHPMAVSMGVLSSDSEAEPALNRASASLALGEAALEKDFVLIVKAKDTGLPKALLEVHPTVPGHRALMTTLVPKFGLAQIKPEIVFVADRSGSMRSNIPLLISAMKVFVKSLPVGVKFNICSFGSSHSFLWPTSQSYTKETLAQATNHINTFAADFGGTETLSAIQGTIRKRYGDIPLEVILLTDGDIWRQEEAFAYVNQESSKGDVRVFPLGIGNGVSHALIEGLARAGNGFAQAVQDGERIEGCVVRMLRGALSAHVHDYSLEVKYEADDDDFELVDSVTEGLNVLLSEAKADVASEQTKEKIFEAEPTKPAEPISLFDPQYKEDEMVGLEGPGAAGPTPLPEIPHPKLFQAPQKIPALFSFTRITVYLLMSPETIARNPTSVILHGTSAQGPLHLEIPVEKLPHQGKTIHQLAARKATQDLEEGRGWIHEAKDTSGGVPVKERFASRFEELVEREAVRLGMQFQVANRWCSFVAVEANTKEKAKEKRNESLKNSGENAIEAYSPPQAYAAVAQSPWQYQGFPVHMRQMQQAASPQPHSSMMASASYEAAQPRAAARVRGFGGSAPQRDNSRPAAKPISPLGGSAGSRVGPPPPSGGFAGSSVFFGGGRVGAFGSRGSSFRRMSRQSAQQGVLFGNNASSVSPDPQSGGLFGSAEASSVRLTAAAPPPAPSSAKVPMSQRRASPHRLCSRIAAPALAADNDTPAKPKDYHGMLDGEKVLELIGLQDFEGYWQATDDVSALIGLPREKMVRTGVEEKVWVTALVVSFLEEKMRSEEGVWEMVVEKARAWLEKEKGQGLAEVMAAAKETI